MGKHLTRWLSKEDKHMKRCFASLVFRGLHLKTTISYHFTPTRMATKKMIFEKRM